MENFNLQLSWGTHDHTAGKEVNCELFYLLGLSESNIFSYNPLVIY